MTPRLNKLVNGMKVFENIEQMIGNTPMLCCSSLCDGGANIYAKLEYKNPFGSVKDRVALSMIRDAERKGILREGSVIVEPTSGNTGIALSAIARYEGYKAIIVMPDSMSMQRRRLMESYGATLVLTEGRLGMAGAIEKARRIAEETPGSFIPYQFENEANPLAHYTTTGPEIYAQMEGKVDIFVASVGTGGTITGIGKYLKEKNPNVEIVAVEPAESAVMSGGRAGPHKIQGIGAGFIPKVMDMGLLDRIICVSGEDAINRAAQVSEKLGAFVGISSGANAHAAAILSSMEKNRGKNIVTIFPDSGERYI